ncbi:MAG: GUN4 domain-containing protein [Scytonema sp. PMC 1070.18]|nr:GUN4 domain-containing protein [Scytonema sp. PMC 1070.18]
MRLNGSQWKELEGALIEAFPDTQDLDRMLMHELEINRKVIAGEGKLQHIVFNLINKANSEGWVEKLILSARNYNPGNSRLKAIANKLLANNPPTTEDAITQYRYEFERHLADDGKIDDVENAILKRLQKTLAISDEKAREIQDEVLDDFSEYKKLYTKLVCEQGDPLRKESQDKLKALQQALNLKDNTILLITETASEKGVDYTKLRNFLKTGQWKEADYETYLVMLQAVGRFEGDWIRSEEVLNFPCTDLRTIDHLWVKYSNGRFGFSVQKQIYLDVGGIPDGKYYEEAWKKFGDRVGWRVKESWIFGYSDATYDTTAPVGHLPGHLPVRVKRAGDV